MDFSWHEAQAARLSQLDRLGGLGAEEREAEESYRMLHANRMRIGLSRLSIGYHLCRLKATQAWRGRTGSKSFHRFMLEEGLEPKAAVQYMAVAQAYLIDHNVEPKAIAGVSMRLLHSLIGRLHPSNVHDIVELLNSLPAAEARAAVQARFPLGAPEATAGQIGEPATGRPRLAPGAYRIFSELDTMSFDERRELYRVLHLKAGADHSAAVPSSQGQASVVLTPESSSPAGGMPAVQAALAAANDPLRQVAFAAA